MKWFRVVSSIFAALGHRPIVVGSHDAEGVVRLTRRQAVVLRSETGVTKRKGYAEYRKAGHNGS